MRTLGAAAWCVIGLTSLLAACDPEKPEFTRPQKQAMDKAKGVEQTLEKNAQQQREKIDEQTKQ